jgi:hypothetical protein
VPRSTCLRHLAAALLATALVCALVVVWACGGDAPSAQWPALPAPIPVDRAPDPVAGLTVAVGDVTLNVPNADPQKVATQTAGFRGKLGELLLRAGFRPVLDQSTPHDLTVSFVKDENHLPAPALDTYTLTFVGKGTVVAMTRQQLKFLLQGQSVEAWLAYILTSLLNDATRSPDLAAYARSLKEGAASALPPVAGPPSAPPAGSGCSKDTDCKGDRVCSRGQCVDPH